PDQKNNKDRFTRHDRFPQLDSRATASRSIHYNRASVRQARFRDPRPPGPAISTAMLSLRDALPGAAEFSGKILQLGQAIAHRQHRLGVVDVNARGEGERRDRCGEHVDEAERRMIGHQMPAAFRAVLTLAELALLEAGDML